MRITDSIEVIISSIAVFFKVDHEILLLLIVIKTIISINYPTLIEGEKARDEGKRKKKVTVSLQCNDGWLNLKGGLVGKILENLKVIMIRSSMKLSKLLKEGVIMKSNCYVFKIFALGVSIAIGFGCVSASERGFDRADFEKWVQSADWLQGLPSDVLREQYNQHLKHQILDKYSNVMQSWEKTDRDMFAQWFRENDIKSLGVVDPNSIVDMFKQYGRSEFRRRNPEGRSWSEQHRDLTPSELERTYLQFGHAAPMSAVRVDVPLSYEESALNKEYNTWKNSDDVKAWSAGFDEPALRQQFDEMQKQKAVEARRPVGSSVLSLPTHYRPGQGAAFRAMTQGMVGGPSSSSSSSVSRPMQNVPMVVGNALTATVMGKAYGDQSKVNEDFFVIDNQNHIYGVFDGNGKDLEVLARSMGMGVRELLQEQGVDVSKIDFRGQLNPSHLAQRIGRDLVEQLRVPFRNNDDNGIRQVFANVQAGIESLTVTGSGSTATVAHINPETRMLTVVSVGDSPAVLCSSNGARLVYTPTKVDKAFGNQGIDIKRFVQINRFQLTHNDTKLLLMSDGVSNPLQDNFSNLCALEPLNQQEVAKFMVNIRDNEERIFEQTVERQRQRGGRDIAAKIDDSTLIVVPLK